MTRCLTCQAIDSAEARADDTLPTIARRQARDIDRLTSQLATTRARNAELEELVARYQRRLRW